MTTHADEPRPDRAPPPAPPTTRPLALITGVGRTVGIGAGIAQRLAVSGWDIAFTYWTPYDTRMSWGIEPGATEAITRSLAEQGAASTAIEADLADPDAPAHVFDEVGRWRGGAGGDGGAGVTALVMCHCESVDSGLLDTTLESFDRHFAVNARAHLAADPGVRPLLHGDPGNRPDHQPHQRPHGGQPAVRGE